MNQDRVILSIDLDYFFAQCEEIRNPDLKDKPLVVCVYSGRTETSGAVSTANYVARNLGVKSGIPIAFAKKALEGHPESVFLPVDHEYYKSISERVMEIVRSFSPIFEQVSVDEAFLDLTKESFGDYEKAHSLGKDIKQKILEQEKLTCSLGIGPNKLIAKMAADHQKPNGLTTIRPNEVSVFLNGKPVGRLLGIGSKTEKKMNDQLGIKTIDDLAKFDVSTLARTFGRNLGPHFSKLAKGIDEEPVKEKPIEQLSRIITLKDDADEFSFEQELAPLAADISRRLKDSHFKFRQIGIIGITTQLKTKNRSRMLSGYSDSQSEILENSKTLFQELFDSERKEKNDFKLRRIGIRVGALNNSDQKKENKSENQSSLTGFMTTTRTNGSV
jgi:DNA polymerase IV (DinB-like DNA polymerase)